MHSAVDDHSRLAYSEFLNDETANTAIGFMHRAVGWFNKLGILIQEIMTDNGSPYVSYLWADTLESLDIDHIRTGPYRPQTNGEVERYQKTLATEFAYANEWRKGQARTDALDAWLHEYNHDRYHTAIDGPPISRVNNLTE